MNYLLVRRLRGPVFLLTFGVTALLNEWDVLSFGRSWPLYLIVAGVLRLLEGAVLASAAPVTPFSQAGYPPPNAPMGFSPQGYQPVAPVPGTGLATVAPAPIHTTSITKEES